MKTSPALLLVLISCRLCTAQTQRPEELVSHPDVWVELRCLRDMVVEQKVELRHLAARVTAAESLAAALEVANTATEARMAAAESSAEELQMENDVQAADLALAQQKLGTLQQRLAVGEQHVEELEKQQEGHQAALQELQNSNEVGKVAFSASLLASGEGNTCSKEFVPLIYKNIFTNVGNHYNLNTGYFTAPVRGAYYFRFTGHVVNTHDSMRMKLEKNGHFMTMAGDRHATAEDGEDGASNGVVLQLEVGDVVSVQIAGCVWDDDYHRTTLSGFLLFAL